MEQPHQTRKVPHFRTTRQGPLCVEGTILLHVRPHDLCVKVWFRVVHNLAADMLFGTTGIARFLC